MNHLDDLKKLINDMEYDYQKFFEKGINSSASKLRKSLQELKAYAQKMRGEIQQVKESRKKKTDL